MIKRASASDKYSESTKDTKDTKVGVSDTKAFFVSFVRLVDQKRRFALVLLAALLLVLLAGCGGSGITQTSRTQHYNVQLSLDGAGFGERTATIDVSDLGGKPVAADQVVLASVMQQMGMAAPEVIAQPIAPGRYQAKGEFFSMVGEWDVAVRVSAGGSEETASFKIPVNQ